MKKILSAFFVGAVMLAASAYTIQAIINWKIDNEKSLVKFTMQAHGQQLVGSFQGVKGDINFDEKHLDKSSIAVTIDIATVNTGNKQRDTHLQAKEFFDAATTPAAKFVSTKIVKTDSGYVATGNFSVKATTKEITVPFTYEGTKEAGVFKGTTQIKRNDFGIGDATKPDPGNDIAISFEVPVTKN